MTWVGTERSVIDGVLPPLISQVFSLGALLDTVLHLDIQVAAVARSTFHQLHLLRRLQPFLLDSNPATITQTCITSRLDYCNVLYTRLPLESAWRLQLVQHMAACLLRGVGH